MSSRLQLNATLLSPIADMMVISKTIWRKGTVRSLTLTVKNTRYRNKNLSLQLLFSSKLCILFLMAENTLHFTYHVISFKYMCAFAHRCLETVKCLNFSSPILSFFLLIRAVYLFIVSLSNCSSVCVHCNTRGNGGLTSLMDLVY